MSVLVDKHQKLHINTGETFSFLVHVLYEIMIHFFVYFRHVYVVSSAGKKFIVYKREANNRLTKINVSFCPINVKHSAGFSN